MLSFTSLAMSNSLTANNTITIVLVHTNIGPTLTLIFTFLTNVTTKFIAKILRAFFKVPKVLTDVLARVKLCSMGLNVVKGSGRTIGIVRCGLITSLHCMAKRNG